MRTDLERPCGKCPFRRESPRGWLGPWNPGALLASIAFEPFPCHLTIKTKEIDGIQRDPNVYNLAPSLQGCAGVAMYLNNKLELSRVPVTLEHQRKLRKIGADGSTVFQFPHEFLAHHTRMGVRSLRRTKRTTSRTRS